MEITKWLKKKGENTYEGLYGEEKAKEIRKKLKESHKGQIPKTAFKKGHKTWNKGLRKDNDERILEYSKYNLGSKHYKWKGGSSFYYHVRARKLLGVTDKDLIVHHKDGNYKNNSLDNLEIRDFKEHARFHNKGKHLSPKTEFKKGNIPWNKKN